MQSSCKRAHYSGEIDKYLNDIRHYKLLSIEEEQELTVKIFNGEHESLDELIKANLRFVVMVAHRYYTGHIPLADLVSDGNIGLMRAAQRYNPNKGVKFITFAYHHIMGNILTSIYQNGSLIRIPKHINQQRNKIEKMLTAMERPTEFSKESFARILDENSADLLFLLKNGIMSPNFVDLSGDNEEFADNSGLMHGIDASTQSIALKDLLNRKMKLLKPKEEYVLHAYFGFRAPLEFTYLTLGNELGMTKEGVRVLKERALLKLRKLISIDEYLEFL